MRQYKKILRRMINCDNNAKENINKYNLNWSQIPNHKVTNSWPQSDKYRILIVEGSGSGKTNAILNLIKHHDDDYGIYLYIKDSYEAKFHYLIKNRDKWS